MLSFEDKYGAASGGGALMGRLVRRRSDGAEGVVRQQRHSSVMVWCPDVRRNLTFRDHTYDILWDDTRQVVNGQWVA